MYGTLILLITLAAGEYRGDFTARDGDWTLENCAPVRRFHRVAMQPAVKISAEDPAYRKHQGEPAGFGYFGRLSRLPDGALVASYAERASNHSHYGHASARGVLRRSTDGGQTWTDPIPGAGAGLPLPDGSMWYTTRKRDGRWWLGRSTDGGLTANWDTPVPGPGPAGPHLLMSNGEVLMQLSESTVIDPKRQGGYWRVDGDNGLTPGPRGGVVRGIIITDQQFSNWQEIPLPQFNYQTDEYWITETKTPGRLIALLRNQSMANYYYQSVSQDYGRTWTEAKRSDVWFSVIPSRPFVMPLQSGLLVALNGERANGRMMLTPSFDEGRTWSLRDRIAICDSPGSWFIHGDYSYPDAAEIGDGRILARYYTAAVIDQYKQWGIWGNVLDTRYITHPYRGVALASDEADAVGRWSFESDDPQAAHDDAHSNYGRLSGGVTRVAGRFGKGLHLDGKSGFVQIVDSPSMRVGTSFTIELFFRTGDPTAEQALVSKRPYYYLGLREGKLLFEVGSDDKSIAPFVATVTGSTQLEANRWYHAAATMGIHFDGYKYMFLYLDGQCEMPQFLDGWHRKWPPSYSHAPDELHPKNRAEAAALTDLLPESGAGYWEHRRTNRMTENLILGCDNLTLAPDHRNKDHGGEHFFAGDIDEVIIHNRYMMPIDVAARAGRGYATKEPGVVLSPVIERPAGATWQRVSVEADTPEGTTIAVDILDDDGNVFMQRARDITALQAASIRLRARLSTTDPHRTPVLRSWSVTWR